MTGPYVPDPIPVAARGLAVFPLPAGGKAPAPRGWAQDATADTGRIRANWPPAANIGVGCWRSGVVVLDLDVPGSGHRTRVRGADSLAAACAARGEPWPDTFTVGTPSGGSHLYFTAPAGVVIGSTSGGTTPLGEGVDTRGPGRGGRGGYVVGPGSLVDGRAYEVTRDAAIAPLPDWISAVLALPVDPDPINLALIGAMAGVGRAAVANWRRRHPDFPAPTGGTDTSPTFELAAVRAWLTAYHLPGGNTEVATD
ncbi:bifunctional DNA primase/polymerase [Actinoallomurus purpureus]|uniref:bifunctional DNA primase/polymerase n=1 Tax=Actinoallomurus purpureus TaxID=478114 RepID=UPI0035564B1D